MKATQKDRILERSNIRIITDMYIKFQSNWDVLRWKTVLKHDIMANTKKQRFPLLLEDTIMTEIHGFHKNQKH